MKLTITVWSTCDWTAVYNRNIKLAISKNNHDNNKLYHKQVVELRLSSLIRPIASGVTLLIKYKNDGMGRGSSGYSN